MCVITTGFRLQLEAAVMQLQNIMVMQCNAVTVGGNCTTVDDVFDGELSYSVCYATFLKSCNNNM